MLKLKLQYFGHLMRRVDSLEETVMLGGMGAGGEGDNRGWDGWMASLTRWTWVWVNSGSWWWTGRSGVLRFTGSQRVRHNWATELNWTECWSWSSNTLATGFKEWIIGKDPDAGKDWGQEEKRAAKNEMVRWHHQLNGHEFEQVPEDGEGQGSLVCCSPWSCQEADTT